MNYNKNIKESNFTQVFTDLYTENKDLFEVYQTIKDNHITGSYVSITSNHDSLFIYNMIVNKVDLHSFEKVINHIYTSSTEYDLGHTLGRFFNHRECDISLLDYKESIRNDPEELGIWYHLYFLFMDIDNDNLIIKKENLSYLLIMISNINKNNIGAIHEAKFPYYCSYFSDNLLELRPVIEVINNNSSYAMEKHGDYRTFFNSFLFYITHKYYDSSTNEKQSVFQGMKQCFNNFDDLYLASLFKNKEKKNNAAEERLELDGQNFCFIENFGSEQIFDFIHNRFVKHIKNISKYHDGYTKEMHIGTLLSEIDSSFSVYLSKYNYDVNFSKININGDMTSNFVYLDALIHNIKKSKQTDLPIDIAQYLQENIEIEREQNKESSWLDIDRFLCFEQLSRCINYTLLDKEIKEKSFNKRKNKL